MRRTRTVVESLGSIVLGFEIIVVFLAALVIFGLGALPPALALGGGGALIVLMIVAVATLRNVTGVILGWLAQAVVVASGVLVHEIFVVGALFVGIWAYCMIVGGRIDRRNAAAEKE